MLPQVALIVNEIGSLLLRYDRLICTEAIHIHTHIHIRVRHNYPIEVVRS